MLEERSLAHLTVDQARVLVSPAQASVLLGMDLAALPHAGSTRLVDAVATPAVPAAVWTARLERVTVPLLDVNRVPMATLRRIPGLTPALATRLVQARPYFSLHDLTREGDDLARVASIAQPYLSHEGYAFIDIPPARLITLRPDARGLLLRYQSTPPPLTEAGLVVIARDQDERLLACRWTVPDEQRPSRRRALKENATVTTLAPFLAAEDGQARAPYPDRLDLALRPDAGPHEWDALLARYQLSLPRVFFPGFGSVRLRAHPHDLGALYRTLRALAQETLVRFVEPTYLALDHL